MQHRDVWSLTQLKRVTPRLRNVRHARLTGLTPTLRGAECGNAILTDADVREIYARAWSGEDQAQIAVGFGVTRNSVSNIKRGWAWTHVTGHQRTA